MIINASRAAMKNGLRSIFYLPLRETSQSTNGQSVETLTRICFTFENTCYGFQLRDPKVKSRCEIEMSRGVKRGKKKELSLKMCVTRENRAVLIPKARRSCGARIKLI